MTTPTSTTFDARFSDPKASALPWPEVARALGVAELYWMSTVRADGRPHVTPLIGLWHDDAFVFCTGDDEQKAVNLRHEQRVAVTTGTNRWSAGFDVVVEGAVERVTHDAALHVPHGQTTYRFG